MLYHSIAPGTAVNLRRKRGEHHETGIPADGDLQPPYACKGLQNYRLAAATAPVRRICGRAGYAGRRTGTAGAQTAAPGTGRRLPCGAAGLQHCAAEAFLPGAKQPKSEPLPSGASLAAISSKVMVFVPSL